MKIILIFQEIMSKFKLTNFNIFDRKSKTRINFILYLFHVKKFTYIYFEFINYLYIYIKDLINNFFYKINNKIYFYL